MEENVQKVGLMRVELIDAKGDERSKWRAVIRFYRCLETYGTCIQVGRHDWMSAYLKT